MTSAPPMAGWKRWVTTRILMTTGSRTSLLAHQMGRASSPANWTISTNGGLRQRLVAIGKAMEGFARAHIVEKPPFGDPSSARHLEHGSGMLPAKRFFAECQCGGFDRHQADFDFHQG